MSKEQRDAVDQMIRQAPRGQDLAEQRAAYEQVLRATPLADDVETTPLTLGGISVVNVDLTGVKSDDVILYLHGGAYAMGSAATSVGLASEVGRRAGARVVTVDYRLAPENPYPAALEDAVAAYRGLLDSGVPASRIAVTGESAGGGLALATLMRLRSEGLPQPSSAVLISPWTDLTLSGASMTSKRAADAVFGPEDLQGWAAGYTRARDAADPLISPVFADLTGLPPLLIQVGSSEILLDDATRLAARAATADVAVTLEVTPGVPHVFHLLSAMLEEADAALTRAGGFLRSHLDA
jgi:acetyl esterase/lipase